MARVTKAAIKLVCNEQYNRCLQQGIDPVDHIFSFDDFETTRDMSDKQWIFASEYWHSLLGEPVPDWIYGPIDWEPSSFKSL